MVDNLPKQTAHRFCMAQYLFHRVENETFVGHFASVTTSLCRMEAYRGGLALIHLATLAHSGHTEVVRRRLKAPTYIL